MRLFLAINFPAELRRTMWQVAEPLRSATLPVRWVAEPALHMTLKFLGDTDAGRTSEIVQALDATTRATRPFSLPVGGFGAFPSVERPRVIWVGCEGVPPLELLQHGLEVGMERLGFPLEGKAFRPHLTLGRVRKEARPSSFRELGSLLGGIDFEAECLVKSVELMESALRPAGPQYRPVHSALLGGRD